MGGEPAGSRDLSWRQRCGRPRRHASRSHPDGHGHGAFDPRDHGADLL